MTLRSVATGSALVIAALAPKNDTTSRDESAGRWVRDGAAGLVGAVATGYAFRFIDAAAAADGLTSAIASFAGGLWVAAIVEAFASRWRSDRTSAVRPAGPQTSPRPIDMPAYDAARQALVAGLLEDAAAHDAGRYGEIGRQLPAIRDSVAREDPSRNVRLQLALRFWNGWTDARNKRWLSTDVDQSIGRSDWPRLARALASDLALDRDVTDPLITHRFA